MGGVYKGARTAEAFARLSDTKQLITRCLRLMQGCGPMVFEMLYNAVPKRLTAKAVEGFSDHNKRGYMKNLLTKLWKEEDGQDLTEYALLLVLLTLAAIGSLGALATAVNGVFSNAALNLQTST